MSEIPEIPRKRYYRTNEVCQYTDTQPYVLQFWVSEFPQLKPGKSRSGQEIYRKRDIDVILRIKQLIYDEDYTISGARKRLDQEKKRKGGIIPRPAVSVKKRAADGRPKEVKQKKERSDLSAAGARAKSLDAIPPEEPALETVPRQRYDDALDEIANLRLRLKDTESDVGKMEIQLEKIREELEESDARSERAIARLEQLLELLT